MIFECNFGPRISQTEKFEKILRSIENLAGIPPMLWICFSIEKVAKFLKNEAGKECMVYLLSSNIQKYKHKWRQEKDWTLIRVCIASQPSASYRLNEDGSYDKINRPKCEGGRGIRRTQNINAVLLVKFGWKIITKPDHIWSTIVSKKYLDKWDFFQNKKSTSTFRI